MADDDDSKESTLLDEITINNTELFTDDAEFTNDDYVSSSGIIMRLVK